MKITSLTRNFKPLSKETKDEVLLEVPNFPNWMVGSSRHVNAKKKGLNFLLEYHILILTRQWSKIASEYLVHAKNPSLA